ncbi:hypothetical protein EGW08_017351 [Elysia chlorotica]|uniref:Major facilitator superfamily (MFS) profile domain-containing protein n=1 Tax=Elysia chlorotica TaxID=188477 RepID=A0A3S0ZB32_ELYCH|nr:hypothetical protein EGW08_017351 [Elysia chlorotica]
MSPKTKVETKSTTLHKSDIQVETMSLEMNQLHTIPTRRLMLTTLRNSLSLFVLGVMLSIKGPSFIDLQLITGTDIEGGSAFFTAYAFGYMLGSLLAGAMYYRVESKALLIAVPMVLAGLTCVATPYCENYLLMVLVHVLNAGFSSIFETTANTEEVRHWEGRSDSAMQFLSFTYSLGGIVGPLLLQPFLAPEGNDSTAAPLTFSQHKVSLHTNFITNGSTGFSPGAVSQEPDEVFQEGLPATLDGYRSRIHIPYIIAGSMCIVAALPFLLVYLRWRCKAVTGEKRGVHKVPSNKVEEDKPRKLPLRVYVMLIGLLSAFYFFYTSVDDPFSMYLSTFVVSHLSWSKESGAVVSAVYWVCSTVTKLVMVVLVRHVNASLVMLASTLGMVLSTLMFVVSSSLYAHKLVWLATALLALSQSAIFGGAFAWADSHLLRLDGRVTSCAIFFAALGAMIDPMLIGVTMKEISPMAFPYLMLMQSFITFLLFLAMLLLASPYVLRRFGPPRGSCSVDLNAPFVVTDERDEECGSETDKQLFNHHSSESFELSDTSEMKGRYTDLTSAKSEEDKLLKRRMSRVNHDLSSSDHKPHCSER